MIKSSNKHAPVILLLEGGARKNNESIIRWIKNNRFAFQIADDIIELLEDMADFTVRDRPDVFVLEVDCLSDELNTIKQFVQTPDGGVQIPIFALSGTNTSAQLGDCFIGDLSQVTSQLNHVIPKHKPVHQTAL